MNEFIVCCGPMMSGKTSSLLAYVDRAKYQKRSVIALKPAIDARYDAARIVSHAGWGIDAYAVQDNEDAGRLILESNVDIVAFDEAFMIPGIANVLIDAFRRQRKDVIVSSLDLSYKCEPFEEIALMFPIATEVRKFSSVCMVCSNDARYTHKKVWNEIENQVGGHDVYEPRCFDCHPCLGGR